jgi:hypothetical protein
MKADAAAVAAFCLFLVATPAYASDSIRLTDDQMDHITAGGITPAGVHRAYQSYLNGGPAAINQAYLRGESWAVELASGIRAISPGLATFTIAGLLRAAGWAAGYAGGAATGIVYVLTHPTIAYSM